MCEGHIAFLLREGSVCRVRYREEPPGSESKEKRLRMIANSLSMMDLFSFLCSDDDAASTSSARSRGSRSASPRPEGEDRGPSNSFR